ncbi:putative transposase [Saccharolobus shibatae]|uniref:Putative transposase n=1 Tax=Saccharolobus shibatae TaxID=2286 RepID=A0A8F5BV37_9CREN|nr:putative transposase [Saccharolobus shibatae]
MSPNVALGILEMGYKIEPFDKRGMLLEKLSRGEGLSEEEKDELKEKLGRNLNDEKLALKQLVELLKSLEAMVKEVEDMIVSKIPQPVVELSPGVGLISVTIYAEFGDVSRFSSSKARAYAGFAPRTKQSGESESHSGMIMGNKYLRRAFFLVARKSESFKEYYDRLVSKWKSAIKLVLLVGSLLVFVITL